MRFLLAAMLFILSLSLLLLGLAQRTIWAPPDEFAVTLTTTAEKPYLVIPSEQLNFLPGPVTVSSYGSDTVFIALGQENDVLSWVGSSNHYLATTSTDGSSLGLREIVGEGEFDSPIGSDLWIKQEVGQSSGTLTIKDVGTKAILIASDGFDPSPSTVRLSWPIVTSTVISDIFLGVGFTLLLAAIVLNLLALRKMIINRGPRRKLPRAPQGPKYRPRSKPTELPQRGRRSARRNFVAMPVAIGLMLSISACSAPVTPTQEPTPTPSSSEPVVEQIPPVVTSEQVERIIADLQQVVAEADQSGDLRILSNRLAGPALRFREAYYILMSKSDEIEPPAPITGPIISISLPASTNLWPRSVMVVTEGEGELPQMLVLQQASPRDQYKLWYNIPLLPGSEIPPVPTSEVGSIPVESTSLFLKLPPDQLATAFGDVIDNGATSQYFSFFNLEGDEFYDQISKSQREQIEKLKKAKITFSHALGDPNVISLSTSDSGALVALLMTDNYLIKPTKANAAVTVSGIEQILLGVEGSTKGVRTTYGDMLLFFVPAANSDQRITLLGATQSLLTIRVL